MKHKATFAVLLSLLSLARGSRDAAASSPVRWSVEYKRAEGADSCPSESEVQRQLASCLCAPSTHVAAAGDIRISVRRRDNVFEAQARIARDADAGTKGASDPAHCDAAVTAVVLDACALAGLFAPCDAAPPESQAGWSLDPVGLQFPDAERSSRPVALPAPVRLGGGDTASVAAGPSVRSTPLEVAPASVPMNMELSAGGEMIVRVGEIVRPGVTTELAVRRQSVSLGLSGSLDLATQRGAHDAWVDSGALTLLPCWRGAFVSACGLLSAGILRQPENRWLMESSDFQAGLGGRVALDLPFREVFSFRLHVRGGVALREEKGVKLPLATATTGVGVSLVWNVRTSAHRDFGE